MDIGEYEVLIWGLNEKVLVVRLVGCRREGWSGGQRGDNEEMSHVLIAV